MNADMIRWMIKATSILAAVLSFILLAAMTLSYEPGKILLRAYEELGRSLKEKRGVLNYSGIERYLLQMVQRFTLEDG